MRMLLISLTLCMCILASSQVEAATISVDADLSHPDLSLSNPIDFTVHFPTAFASIELLTMDSFWISDGLDGGETVAYTPDLAGVGNFPGQPTQFFRRLTFPGFVLSPFLDGAFEGIIYADIDIFCHELGLPCNEGTTVTYDRLVFTIDGVPTPEPATGALLVLTSPLLFLCLRLRNRRNRNQAAPS